MELLFASEYLLPARGGAERFVAEAATGLAQRGHLVRVLSLGGEEPAAADGDEVPAPGAGAPGGRRLPGPAGCGGAVEARVLPDPAPRDLRWRRREHWRATLERALGDKLARRPAELVVGQLHTGPAAVRAAHAAGVPAALLLPSHEAFCAWAFAADTRCRPESGCRACPRFLAQPPAEQRRQLAARAEQRRALADAELLLAPSRSLAATCEGWCGRRPEVVAPLVLPEHSCAARTTPVGPVVLAASQWTPGKGVDLLAPLAQALAPRRVRVQWSALAPTPAVLAALERAENVELLRPPLPLADLLDDAGVVLVPSQAPEAFGRLAVEAMAAGVPVLASASGGLRETVPATQRVRPHDDPAAWVEAVRLLEQPVAWERARDAGLAAAEQLRATRPLERLEQLLVETVGGGRHRRDGPAPNSSGQGAAAPRAQDGLPRVHAARPSIVWMLPHAYHPSGLADEARSAVRALERAGLQPAARNVDELGDPALVAPADRELLRTALGRPVRQPALAVHHYRPLPHRRERPGAVNVARPEWETDTLPAEWLEWLLEMDEVWATCRRNADAFERGGVPPERLRVLGQTIDFDALRPGLEPWPVAAPPGRMLFLSTFDFSERKGWRQLLLAWARAFEPHDPVALLLKTGSVRELADEQVDARIEDFLRRELGGAPHAPVRVLSRMLPAAAMPRIYAAADAYVSASRGEAWGRTWMEALACGLPAIGTRFGGNEEWMADLPGVRLVGGELVPVRPADEVLNPLYHGQRWGEADVGELAGALRAVAADPAGERERAAGARPLLIERHGSTRFAQDVEQLARAALGAERATPAQPPQTAGGPRPRARPPAPAPRR